jgi:hypothetical protein
MTKESVDYTYPVSKIKLHKSSVCLEDPYFWQLFFLYETVMEFVSQGRTILGYEDDKITHYRADNSTDDEILKMFKNTYDPDRSSCNNLAYTKFMLQGTKEEEHKFSDYHEIEDEEHGEIVMYEMAIQ